MPRLKKHNRSIAAKKSMEERLAAVVASAPLVPTTCFPPPTRGPSRRGTGRRHRVSTWPVSPLTGRSHKMIIPAESPDKKFVLFVGDSHLRAIVDGHVKISHKQLSFGLMSTPGADAKDLRTEMVSAVLPRTPDLVCVLAPSNNLTKGTLDQAAVDFEELLTSALSRWPKLFVLDFPPRRNVDQDLQELFRQEFHRVAARKGVRYYSIAEFFPLSQRDLWSWDGVHLSDGSGMRTLVTLLCDKSSLELAMAVAQEESRSMLPAVPAPAPRLAPRLVVVGEARSPRPLHNPLDWKVVEPRRTGSSSPPKGGKVQLRDCSIPLTPVWFSPPMLEMMDSVRPGNLDQKEPSTSAKGPMGVKRPRSPFAPKKSCGKQKVKVEEWPELPKAVSVEVGDWPGVPKAVEEVPVERPRRRIVFKKRRTSQQQGAAADVVEVMSGPSPVTIEDCPPLHSSPDLIQSKVAVFDALPVTFDAGSVSSGEEEIIVVSDTDRFRGTQKLFEIAGVRVTVKVDGGASQSSSGKIGAKRKATTMPSREDASPEEAQPFHRGQEEHGGTPGSSGGICASGPHHLLPTTNTWSLTYVFTCFL
ncbi:uncharacterized protein LOC131469959 [Solea solea]|uniref:uncharacterized protein LOC131469959 n=1 Tax=Solea solea TaxID=90069 RepID=UPI00272A2F76|nr:uncharacterized protein LOC131469959 [Solea solea]